MTPQALPVLDAVIASSLPAAEKLRLVASFDLALGLGLLDLDRALCRCGRQDAELADAEVETLLDERQQARAAKDFAAADAARDRLKAAGVDIMDGDPLRWEWRPRLIVRPTDALRNRADIRSGLRVTMRAIVRWGLVRWRRLGGQAFGADSSCCSVVGTRPEAIKIAPIALEARGAPSFDTAFWRPASRMRCSTMRWPASGWRPTCGCRPCSAIPRRT